MKGLVPYAGKGIAEDGTEIFPHSLEFSYLPLGGLMRGLDDFDWGPVESLLDAVSARGHQAILRVYLEYPGKHHGIPEFLVKGGLRLHPWTDESTKPFPAKPQETPDYEDPALRAALAGFIQAFGRKYDGDPRLGFLTAGLLGSWGEWHNYPHVELWASLKTQTLVMDAYSAAFRKTPVLLRYPSGEGGSDYAANAARPFGYHDDSFAWSTLPSAKKGSEWNFMSKMDRAGAMEKWRNYPIGGEVRPEVWGICFDDPPGTPEGQAFADCVEATHATWLMDSGVFRRELSPERRARALRAVERMGYELQVTEADFPDTPVARKLSVRIKVVNRGVAPPYYDWPVMLALADARGVIRHETKTDARLRRLIPGDAAQTWTGTLQVDDAPPGEWRLVLMARNPLTNGAPIRFANESQHKDLAGWLSLGIVRVEGQN